MSSLPGPDACRVMMDALKQTPVDRRALLDLVCEYGVRTACVMAHQGKDAKIISPRHFALLKLCVD